MGGGRWLIAQTKFDCLVFSVQCPGRINVDPRPQAVQHTQPGRCHASRGGRDPSMCHCVISQNIICASKIFVHVLKIFAAGGDEDCAGCGGAAREEAGLGETM